MDASLSRTHESIDQDFKVKKIKVKRGGSKGKITTDEDDEQILVNFQTYREYFMDYFGGWSFIFLSNFSMIAYIVAKLFSDYLMGNWANDPDQGGAHFLFYTLW